MNCLNHSGRFAFTCQKLQTVPLICEELNFYVRWKNHFHLVVSCCLHSLCWTMDQRAVAPAGQALAEPPASTGRASRGRWSPCCPTHTQAPTTAAESNLWTRTICRCPCSTRLTATAPPFTSRTTTMMTLP